MTDRGRSYELLVEYGTFYNNRVLRISVPAALEAPTPLEAAGMSMRDSATSAMCGWEQQKPDGCRSELILSQLILLES
jgi:hypothetical protein